MILKPCFGDRLRFPTDIINHYTINGMPAIEYYTTLIYTDDAIPIYFYFEFKKGTIYLMILYLIFTQRILFRKNVPFLGRQVCNFKTVLN